MIAQQMLSTRHLLLFTLLLSLLLSSFSANSSITLTPQQNPTFLPVDEAYQVKTDLNHEKHQLRIQWLTAANYYLYHASVKINLFNGLLEPLEHSAELPAGKIKYDPVFEEDRELHYGTLELLIDLAPYQQSNLEPDQTLKFFSVDYQGCAEAGLCYPPQTRHFQVNSDSTLQAIEQLPTLKNTPLDSDKTQLTAETESKNSSAFSGGLWLAASLAFIGGLLLNLMPCVLPVLSIKVLSLTSSVQQPHRRHLHGLAYSAGVIICFLFIASILLILRQAGQAIGWGFQLQSPTVVATLAYLFVIMALSLAGMFELGSRLMGLGSGNSSNAKLSNSFNTGLLAAVVASPCTAPFMGVAIGWAVTQPPSSALFVFASLGAGMASPFALLCYSPSLLNKLPKPGQWMLNFKEFCAFPLLATALWLLWVLGHQTNSDILVAFMAGILLLLLSIWFWRFNSRSLKALSLLLLLCSVWLSVFSSSHKDDSPVFWQDYSPLKLEQLRSDNKAVFINLTADWCITCLANEKLALSQPAFQQRLQDCDITYLKGDWTNYDAEITHLLETFNRNGVPLYLYYPANNQPTQILPQLLSQDIVAETLSCDKT